MIRAALWAGMSLGMGLCHWEEVGSNTCGVCPSDNAAIVDGARWSAGGGGGNWDREGTNYEHKLVHQFFRRPGPLVAVFGGPPQRPTRLHHQGPSEGLLGLGAAMFHWDASEKLLFSTFAGVCPTGSAGGPEGGGRGGGNSRIVGRRASRSHMVVNAGPWQTMCCAALHWRHR
jgi:hypothetical protein